MRFILTFICLCVGLLLLAAPERITEPPKPATTIELASAASVLVMAEPSAGSGVCYHNGGHVFVWTDAHVVEGRKSLERVLDTVTGQVTHRINFQDVEVWQDDVEEGRKVGKVSALAKIIRYSYRHDIALLKLYKRSAFASATFAEDVPVQGAPIFHIGSMTGVPGLGSFASGHVARSGRLRSAGVGGHSDVDDPLVYDQVSVVAHPGSSGGGIFRYSDGACIGLVVEFLKPGAHGSFMITPTRRLREFARDAQCEWAMDNRVSVPAKDDAPVVTDHFLLVQPEEK